MVQLDGGGTERAYNYRFMKGMLHRQGAVSWWQFRELIVVLHKAVIVVMRIREFFPPEIFSSVTESLFLKYLRRRAVGKIGFLS